MPTPSAKRAQARLVAASPVAIALAMLAIYIVWGTTYLAIRVVVDPDTGTAIPPFAMVAMRFAFAGVAMLVLTLIVARPALRGLTRRQVRDQAIVGVALNVGGLGVTSFGEQTIPSGITALMIALLPIWVAVIGRVVYKDRIAPLTALGIAVGIVGVAILVSPTTGGEGLDPLGLACILFSPLSWGGGSIWSQRRAETPADPRVAVTIQMLAGSLGGAAVALGGLVKPLLSYSDLPGEIPRYISQTLRLYVRAGLFDDAIQMSYIISKLCRDETLRREAQAYRAAALMEVGRLQTAAMELKGLESITRKDDICAPYYYALGKLQIAQTNWPAAQQTAATLVTARPRDLEWMPAGLYLSAQCYAQAGKLEVAKQVLTEIRTAYPTSRWVALADTLEKQLEQPKRKE